VTSYVALLRGINVGGNGIIKMADLKACFEAGGFENVRTYINSGNVLFASDERDLVELTNKVDAMLAKEFPAKPPVVVVPKERMQDVVKQAPKGFGGDPKAYRYNVIFLKDPLTAADAMAGIKAKEGVDFVTEGAHVIYYSNLMAKATQSQLTRIIGTPNYKNMTIRNWNTTTKLLALLEQV